MRETAWSVVHPSIVIECQKQRATAIQAGFECDVFPGLGSSNLSSGEVGRRRTPSWVISGRGESGRHDPDRHSLRFRSEEGMRKWGFLRDSTESPNTHLGDDVARSARKNCAADLSDNRLNLSGYECRQMSPNWLFEADLSPMNNPTRLHSVVRSGVKYEKQWPNRLEPHAVDGGEACPLLTMYRGW